MLTTQLPPDFKEFLRFFVIHEIRFLLIGGYAVNAYGHIRNTVDIDVWIAADRENQNRVINAVRAFGFTSTPADILDESNSMLRMGIPPLRIGVLKSISGVEFEDCWQRRVKFDADGFTVPMISLEDLKINKKASGRGKDLLDLEELSQRRNYRPALPANFVTASQLKRMN